MGPGPAGTDLGGDERLVALALERLAQDLLRAAVGVDVGGVEQVDAGLEADVHQPRGLGDVGCAPGLEKLVAAAERAGAKAENGNLEAGASQKTVFHGRLDAARGRRMQVACLPDSLDTVAIENCVDTDQRHAEFQRLSRQNPVEGIAVMKRQKT